MDDLPDSVRSYLRDHAPDGTLIAYWLDKRAHYNVLLLCERMGAPCFEARAFPQQVEDWTQQRLSGCFSVDEMAVHLAYGLWDADSVTVEKVRQLLDSLHAQQPPATKPS